MMTDSPPVESQKIYESVFVNSNTRPNENQSLEQISLYEPSMNLANQKSTNSSIDFNLKDGSQGDGKHTLE